MSDWDKELLKNEQDKKEILIIEKELEEKINVLSGKTGTDINDIIQRKNEINTKKIEIEKLSSLIKKGQELQNKIKELTEKESDFTQLKKMGWFEGSPYILNKKITCSLCGSKFTAYVTNSKNRYYRCQGYKKKICISKSIIAQKIEDAVRTIFFNVIYEPFIKKEPNLHEFWDRWFFNQEVKKMFDSLYEFSHILPHSLESISNIKKEFENKILLLEEEVVNYKKMPEEVREDIIKHIYWTQFDNWLTTIKFDTIKNEGELLLKSGEVEKRIIFTL